MYDLHSLGWHNFQQLCITVVQEVLGQTVERYLDTHDGGRDGAFVCDWIPTAQEALTGQVVFQCKFTSKAGYVMRLSDLSDEFEKAQRLVSNGMCDSYVLMTNAGLSGTVAEKIKGCFRSAGVRHVLTLGSTWISEQIQQNKRLRMHVPRMYGLGDLSQILDERAYEQSRAILESMRDDLAKVIITDAYTKAVDAINEHSFVLLIGEPASGKTTIASLLSIAAIDNWNSSLIKIEEPADLSDRWNPNEPSQFFWIDDAFGVTQYEYTTVNAWNRALSRIQPMLRGGAKIVMTSRDYIYRRAREQLKTSAFPPLRHSQVVVDVHELSETEKQQILYNHLKLGKQPRAFRKEIKPFLERIASRPRFVPETARRLSDPAFTKGLIVNQQNLDKFVDNREQHLQEILEGLDPTSRAALALIYMRNNRVERPISLDVQEKEALDRLGSDISECIVALNALDDSLVLASRENGNTFWRFKHPTVGDACSAVLAQDFEHVGILVEGTVPARLVDLATCGDVGIENSVVLPPSFYPQMIDKLDQLGSSNSTNGDEISKWLVKRTLDGFLASRCSKDFLKLYLERHPETFGRIAEPDSSLSYSSEVSLARRLNSFGLFRRNIGRNSQKQLRCTQSNAKTREH